MIRYRSASTVPGVNPPDSIESEERSRRTGAEEGLLRCAASIAEGVARPVGICESEETACPHEEQKRTESASSAEQEEQRTKGERS